MIKTRRSCRDDVEALLYDMRHAISIGAYSVEDRKKFQNTLAAIGITLTDAKDELYALTYDDNYIKGPEEDRDHQGTDPYWFFKTVIFRRVVYIKFKVQYLTDGSVFVKSFHIDD